MELSNKTELANAVELSNWTLLNNTVELGPYGGIIAVILDLIESINSRSTDRTVLGYKTASALTDGKSVLLVPANTPAIKNGRQLADNSWSSNTNPVAHTFNGAAKNPYTYCTAIGDSFTSGSDYSRHTEDIDPLAVIVDQGISGDTTTEMLARFQHDILDTQTRVVIIQGGVNDLAAAGADPNATMQSNVTSMTTQAVASGKSVVLINVGPWSNHASWNATKQTWTETYNTWAESFSGTNSIPFVDIYDLLRDGTALAAAFDSGDGLHPNTAGYTAIGAELATVGESTFLSNIETSIIEGVALVNEGTGENVLIRSILPGAGAVPTGWTALVGTGTSLIKPSIFGDEDGAQAVKFIATAERPAIFIDVPFAANTEYTISTILEDMTLRSSGPVLTMTGSGIVSGSVEATAPVGARPGDIISATFVTDSTGGVGSRLRFGLGGSGAATGDMTLSRPQVEIGGRRTPYIPTDTTSAQFDADENKISVSSKHTIGSGAERGQFKPYVAGQVNKYLRSFYIDPTHTIDVYINATQVIAFYVDGANTDSAAFNYTHLAGTDFLYDVYWDKVLNQLGIRADAVSGDIDTKAFTTGTFAGMTALPVTSGIGNKNDADQAVGEFANNGVPINWSSAQSAGFV